MRFQCHMLEENSTKNYMDKMEKSRTICSKSTNIPISLQAHMLAVQLNVILQDTRILSNKKMTVFTHTFTCIYDGQIKEHPKIHEGFFQISADIPSNC